MSMTIDIARLTKKVDVDNQIELRYYYKIADNLIRKADMYRAESKLIDLYVTLIRFISLITETIPYHKDYHLSPRSERRDFQSKLLSVMAELDTLKPDVEQQLAELNRNSSISADIQAQPEQNGSSDPHVSPLVRETAPLIEQHLQANDLSTTPLPNQVLITPSTPQHRTVSRSSHVEKSGPEYPLVHRTMPTPTSLINLAPEQALVHRTMPVPTFLTNSAPEQPLVHRTLPVPTSLTNSASTSAVHIIAPRSNGITSSRTTESYMTDLEHVEFARAIKASIETAIAEGIQIEPCLVHETSRTGTTVSLNDPVASDTTSDQETYHNAYVNYTSDASPNQATVPRATVNNIASKASRSNFEKSEVEQNALCIVCFDSQVEAACIPCGHMAGCLACLKKIEAKSKKCPVCRASVDLVVKIYTI